MSGTIGTFGLGIANSLGFSNDSLENILIVSGLGSAFVSGAIEDMYGPFLHEMDDDIFIAGEDGPLHGGLPNSINRPLTVGLLGAVTYGIGYGLGSTAKFLLDK